jgi:CheY-like chemotaxis protein
MTQIIVIDDDPYITDMLRQILERVGYETACASSAAIGLELCRTNPVELVITDIIMPEKDGNELIIELKSEFKDLKIIAISGGPKIGPYSCLMMAKRSGADRIFSKPVDKGELIAAIQELLE